MTDAFWLWDWRNEIEQLREELLQTEEMRDELLVSEVDELFNRLDSLCNYVKTLMARRGCEAE